MPGHRPPDRLEGLHALIERTGYTGGAPAPHARRGSGSPPHDSRRHLSAHPTRHASCGSGRPTRTRACGGGRGDRGQRGSTAARQRARIGWVARAPTGAARATADKPQDHRHMRQELLHDPPLLRWQGSMERELLPSRARATSTAKRSASISPREQSRHSAMGAAGARRAVGDRRAASDLRPHLRVARLRAMARDAGHRLAEQAALHPLDPPRVGRRHFAR